VNENAWFYTLSTICQTLAGGFGFLVAILLYQMQGIRSQLESGLPEARRYRVFPPGDPGESQLTAALILNDWDEITKILGRSVMPPGVPPQLESDATLHLVMFVFNASRLGTIKSKVRQSAILTFCAVIVSLVQLPFAPTLTKSTFLGPPTLAIPLLMAILAIFSYVPLVISVTAAESRPTYP
jgi:hypothetical protein